MKDFYFILHRIVIERKPFLTSDCYLSISDKSWGIDLFAVTVQNEPEFAGKFEGYATMIFSL